MAQPRVAEIALHKPGDVIQQPEGAYTVNPDGITVSFAPKAPTSTTKQGGATWTRNPDGSFTQATDEQGNPLPATPQRPVVASPKSDIYDADGNLIHAGTGISTASPGSSIIGPKGEVIGQAPESTASVTSAQAALIKAKVDELAQNNKLNEEQKKAAFDTWWKIAIELPRQQEQDAMARQKYGTEQANTAITRKAMQSQWDTATSDSMQGAIQQAFSSRGLAAPARQAPIGNIDDIATAATLKALRDISPTAQAAFGVTQPPVPAVAPPAPNMLPGSTAPTTDTPISDEILRRKAAAAAA